MLEIKSDTQLALGEGIMIQAIPELEHYYAFNIRKGDHFQLNHTAYWVLETIGSGVVFSELSREFAHVFELSSEQTDQDLFEVINFGLENNILKEVPS